MKTKQDSRWQSMDKSNSDLSILIKQFEVQNKTEGKSEKTVRWYNEVLGLFYRWLEAQELPTTLQFMDEDVVRLFILDLQERPGLRGPKMSTHSVAARARGRTGGRPKKLDEQQRQLVIRLYKEGTPIPEILKTVKISKSTLYSYMRNET